MHRVLEFRYLPSRDSKECSAALAVDLMFWLGLLAACEKMVSTLVSLGSAISPSDSDADQPRLASLYFRTHFIRSGIASLAAGPICPKLLAASIAENTSSPFSTPMMESSAGSE